MAGHPVQCRPGHSAKFAISQRSATPVAALCFSGVRDMLRFRNCFGILLESALGGCLPKVGLDSTIFGIQFGVSGIIRTDSLGDTQEKNRTPIYFPCSIVGCADSVFGVGGVAGIPSGLEWTVRSEACAVSVAAYPQRYHAFVAVGLGVVLLRESFLLLISCAEKAANAEKAPRQLQDMAARDLLAQAGQGGGDLVGDRFTFLELDDRHLGSFGELGWFSRVVCVS